jgi:energy-coupling factor transporter ATP-binding protein EcfA2
MRQRVAIARALILEPKILLMDEPFGRFDEQTRIILGEELLKIRDALNQTIIFVTHNINESVQLSDRVLVMTARRARSRPWSTSTCPTRDSSIIASDRFGRLVARYGSPQRESIKVFATEKALGGTMKKQLRPKRASCSLAVLLACLNGTSSVWAAAARTKLILVVPHRVLFTVAVPVYVAQEKGFYRENNIDVDAVFTRGGGENVQAVVSGDAQIGLPPACSRLSARL